jgi:hypothetical protein
MALIEVPVRGSAEVEAQAKADGIQAAVDGMPRQGYGPEDLPEMRTWARWFVHANESMRTVLKIPRVIWIDIVREHFHIAPLAGRGNNWLGGFFCKPFVWTGQWIKSKTTGGHGNDIRLWTLEEYNKGAPSWI